MAIEPDNAAIRHAIGLSLVRQHDYAAALPFLRQASELAPDNGRFGYVYAIALNSAGQSHEAIALLQQTHQRHPADWDAVVGLAMIARDAGDLPVALQAARDMASMRPADPQVRALLRSLEAAPGK